MSRARFTVTLLIVGLLSSIPGVLLGIGLGSAKGAAILLAAAAIATVIGAQPFYSSVKEKLRIRRVPWMQYLGIVTVSYALFGCVMALFAVLSQNSLSIGWPLFGALFVGWMFFFGFAVMWTSWLAVPLSLWVAFKLVRSNKPLHATCEDADV